MSSCPATAWVPGFLLASPAHLLYNPCLLFHAVPSCPTLQLWPVKVPRFRADSEDGNAQEINSEPSAINRHLQSHGEGRAAPAAAGTAPLTSHCPSCQWPGARQEHFGDIRNNYWFGWENLHCIVIYLLGIFSFSNLWVSLLMFWEGKKSNLSST